jgi:hypothetical protein
LNSLPFLRRWRVVILLLGVSVVAVAASEGLWDTCGSDSGPYLGTCDPTGCTGNCTYVVNSMGTCSFSLFDACYYYPPGTQGPPCPGTSFPGACTLITGMGGGGCFCKGTGAAGTPVMCLPNCM